mmetsp:Transcript_56531/g.131732  ORF Transcript_56531/g.131732 Transcript_56531/m.131732 type:complete len:237 (-) Transcript_56531:143-853(-)
MGEQNWLWGLTHNEKGYRHCWDSGWDNDISTVGSHALFAVIQLVAVAVIIVTRNRAKSAPLVPELQQEHNSSQQKDSKERLWHLDYARIACVACVVAEHTGGTMHTHFNVFFVLQWAVPALRVHHQYTLSQAARSVVVQSRPRDKSLGPRHPRRSSRPSRGSWRKSFPSWPSSAWRDESACLGGPGRHLRAARLHPLAKGWLHPHHSTLHPRRGRGTLTAPGEQQAQEHHRSILAL